MFALLVAAAKILAVKAGTSIEQANLPCQPTFLVLCPLQALLINYTLLQNYMPWAIYFS
jgi:hypothetical protein